MNYRHTLCLPETSPASATGRYSLDQATGTRRLRVRYWPRVTGAGSAVSVRGALPGAARPVLIVVGRDGHTWPSAHGRISPANPPAPGQ